MPLALDIARIVNSGLDVEITNTDDCFVAKATRSGKTIAEVSGQTIVDLVDELTRALITLAVPKTASVDDNLAKAFS